MDGLAAYSKTVLFPLFALLCVSASIVLETVVIRVGTYWSFAEGFWPLAIVWVCAALLYIALAFLLRDKFKALPIAMLSVLAFFQYGQALVFLNPLSSLMAMTAFVIVCSALILKFPTCKDLFFKILFTFSWLWCAYYLSYTMVISRHMTYDLSEIPAKRQIINPSVHTPDKEKPDIYFIVQDAYAFNETLKRLFDYNNQSFLDFLVSKGFYVAKDSRSYYSQTMLSIPSTLNLDYLQNDVRLPHTDFADRKPLIAHHLRPRLIKFLKDQGYDLNILSTGYAIDTTFDPNKMDIRSKDMKVTVWDTLIARTPFSTLCGFIFENRRTSLNPYYEHYQTIRNEYLHLRQVSLEHTERPKFVYAHVLAPHPPFVFDPSGNFADYPYEVPFSYSDGAYHKYSRLYDGGWNAFYKKAYVAQLLYVNKELSNFIQTALKNPGTRPKVIIIEGDHGSRMKEYFESADHTDMQEIFGILNAVYFSDGDYRGLSQDISPINVMRVMVNKYFGTQMPKLENRHWFSTWSHPYQLIDETKRSYAQSH